MGIRVHKYLGYGLHNLDNDGDLLTDPRVNAGSWLITRDGVPRPAEYLAWLESRSEAQRRFSLDLAALKGIWPVAEGRGLGDCCARGDADGGLPGVLVLQPFACGNWHRFDDIIDWITESYQLPGEGVRVPARKDPVSHCAVLPNGIYPFDGLFMDARDGRRLPGQVMWWLRTWNDLKARGTGISEIHIGLLDELARDAGLAGHAEAAGHAVPLVPQEIRDLAEFGQLFTHAGIWRQLRPVLYTYWR